MITLEELTDVWAAWGPWVVGIPAAGGLFVMVSLIVREIFKP